MTTAKLIQNILKDKYYSNESLTLVDATDYVTECEQLKSTCISEMAEDDMYAQHFFFEDDSHLIIDDEGYIYCEEDDEINILCSIEVKK